MNSMDAKALKILEQYVDEYKIFIDTCSLMFDKAEDFLSRLMPIVKKKGLVIFVPLKCKKELEKHSIYNTDLELVSAARKGLSLLEKYAVNISIREDMWESTGSFADNVFKTVFTMHRDKYNLMLITQDNNLASEIKALNTSKAVLGHRVEAKRINKYGFLSHYDWEENTSKPIKTTSIEKNIDAFKLCTSITKISTDTIRISSVPAESSVVYTEDGSTVKIGAHIAGGGEGDVYETNTSYVAKIYKENKLDKRKEVKIKKIIQKKIQCPGVCFPICALTNKKREFVGYLMPRAKGIELSKSIFLGKMMIAKKLPDWKKKDLVQLCITILEKISFLHSYNIILGDINGGNILIVSPTEIYFVDVDSYQIEDIPCPVGVDQFTPKEILGKDFKTFLRTFGNEYYAISALLFRIMLPGKSPYAQKGGADLIENIQKMDFSFPFEEKSNKKTPPGAWGYIWSHLSYKTKRAFYNTFSSDGENSTESQRIPPSEWLNIFRSYYYELTDGNIVKNDSMSNEIFPTRLKNSNFNSGNADINLSVKTIKCKICGSHVDETLTTKGICQWCLTGYRIVNCSKCGKGIRYYGRQEYLERTAPPTICDKCQIYTKITCCDCGTRFEITVGEKEFYDKQGYDLPKRCKDCKQKQSLGVGRTTAHNTTTNSLSNPYTSKYTPPQPRATASPSVPKSTKLSSISPRLKSQDFLTKKKEIATKEIEKYFDKLNSIAERKLGFFARRSFNKRILPNKSQILRLIGNSRSIDDLEDYIDKIHNAVSDLYSEYFEDLDDFMVLVTDIVDLAETILED